MWQYSQDSSSDDAKLGTCLFGIFQNFHPSSSGDRHIYISKMLFVSWYLFITDIILQSTTLAVPNSIIMVV